MSLATRSGVLTASWAALRKAKVCLPRRTKCQFRARALMPLARTGDRAWIGRRCCMKRLGERGVVVVRVLLATTEATHAQLAQTLGVNVRTIRRAAQRRTYRGVPPVNLARPRRWAADPFDITLAYRAALKLTEGYAQA
jgi:hypothetical protein